MQSLLFLAAVLPAHASIGVTDDIGRKVELGAPAQRIVTLAPFLTELVFSAGAGARVVAVSAYSDYPAEAKALPQVATAASLSLEEVAAQRADLVFAWKDSIRAEDIARLQKLGIATYVAQARRLDDVPRLLGAIGTLTGRDVSRITSDYAARLAALRAKHRDRPRVRVFLEVWHQPLTTIAGAHWINEALALCGGENAFADLPGVAPHVPWEEVYRRDPPAIIGAGSRDGEAQFLANWRTRGTLSAVRTGKLVHVEADTLQRPTLRLLEGVAQLCAGIDRVR